MLASQCELGNWKLPLQCRRPLPCDLRHFDPGAQFNRKLLQRARARVWAKNNDTEPALPARRRMVALPRAPAPDHQSIGARKRSQRLHLFF